MFKTHLSISAQARLVQSSTALDALHEGSQASSDCTDCPENPSIQQIRSLVTNAKIPLHVVCDGKDHYISIHRFAYFEQLATRILRNNTCNFRFTFNGMECDTRYSIGLNYDLSDPDTIPWSLNLERMSGERRDMLKEHLNSLKTVEYLETGGINCTNKLTQSDIQKIKRDLESELYQCNLGKRTATTRIAARIHFSDGTNLVKKMYPDEVVYGVVQGIIVSHVRVGDLLYLKDVDNWLHISFPNATINVNIPEVVERKIHVTLQAVGSTPQIAKNRISLSASANLRACLQYVENLIKKDDLRMYVDAVYGVDADERLYNVALDSDRIHLYYSVGDAWT